MTKFFFNLIFCADKCFRQFFFRFDFFETVCIFSLLPCQHGCYCIYSPHLIVQIASVSSIETKYSFVQLFLMNLIEKAYLHIGGVISYNWFLFNLSFNVFPHITQIVSCNSGQGVEMFYSQFCFSIEVLKVLCRKLKPATLQKFFRVHKEIA